MVLGNVIIPDSSDDEFVELARNNSGTLYRKQILPWGAFRHPSSPNDEINIDRSFYDKLKRNFDDGACDIVQVPLVNDANQHVEDPLRNLGEVVDLGADDKGVYAMIDARKPEYADELGKTLLGASAMMHLDYTDTKTGEHVGPTLLHVAVTNRPYLTNLTPYEKVVGLSADSTTEPAVVLTAADLTEGTEVMPMTKEELLAALKDEHGIDVADLEAKAKATPALSADGTTPVVDESARELLVQMSATLEKISGKPISRDDEGVIDITDVAEAVVELSREKTDLEGKVATLVAESDALKLSAAESKVDEKIRTGYILPAQKDVMLKLSMTDPESYEALIPAAPIVEMSARGVDYHEAPGSDKIAEIDRLAGLANARKSSRTK